MIYKQQIIEQLDKMDESQQLKALDYIKHIENPEFNLGIEYIAKLLDIDYHNAKDFLDLTERDWNFSLD